MAAHLQDEREMSRARRLGSDLNAIEGEAIAWVQKLTSGEATAADRAALVHWRAQSAEHETAFAAAERIWGKAAVAARALGNPDDDIHAELDALRAQRKSASRRSILLGGAVVVAAGAAYGMARPPFGLWPSLAELRADYHTRTGEQQNITFAGDVAISLNTQTSLVVRLADGAHDRIELVDGEASFVLPARAARSFSVLAAGGSAVTNGGRFDVRYTPGGGDALVSVTCFDGRVRIEKDVDAADLGPGQRVRYGASGLTQVAAVDPAIASEWQRGIVEFRGTPLSEAVEEINRYRPGRIILMSKALGQQPISGRFRIDQMDKVLAQLEFAFNARVQRLPGGFVLLS